MLMIILKKANTRLPCLIKGSGESGEECKTTRLMATQGLRRKLLGSSPIAKVPSRVFSPSYGSILCFSYTTERIVDVGQPTPSSHPQLLVDGEITPGITSAEYISRRKRLLELLPEKSLAIIASAPVKMMTDVVPYTFRQDADYLYITGCSQPGGVAVLSEHGLHMFMPDSDPHDVAWQGQVAGVDAALDFFKADKAFPLSKIDKFSHLTLLVNEKYKYRNILPEMLGRASRLFHNVKTAVPSYMGLEPFQRATYNNKVKDLSYYTHQLRWIKSPSEQKLMKQSASITCQALLQTMLLSRTHPEESKLAAKVEFECRMRGAQRMAFNPVVGGGAHGSVIHYSRNDQKIGAGELVLMDVGCELHGYLSDLTRTWPPSGSFSTAQTNKECMKLCKPGASIQQIHSHSVRMLRRGFKELGILKDDNSHSYHQLNPTEIGHYLGMDIHDSATVGIDRPLQPGVVITIEPGVYIAPSCDVPDRYRGIGVRIEDEVLITETGYEVLTGSMPKEIARIKSLLNLGQSTGMEAAHEQRVAFS